MFYAFVFVTIGLFAIGSFEGVNADGNIKNNISLINHRYFYPDIFYGNINEPFLSGFSVISSNGYCRLKSNRDPRKCRNDRVGVDFSTSLSGCKDVCSAHATCVGFYHLSDPSDPNEYCFPIQSDLTCPAGFYDDGTGPLPASMNDLTASTHLTESYYTCYGKKLGKVFQSLHFVLKFP